MLNTAGKALIFVCVEDLRRTLRTRQVETLKSSRAHTHTHTHTLCLCVCVCVLLLKSYVRAC
jgi:hypothetical protein